MPNPVRPLLEGDAVGLTRGVVGVEQAQVHPGRVLRKQSKIDAFAVPGRTETERVARPDAHALGTLVKGEPGAKSTWAPTGFYGVRPPRCGTPEPRHPTAVPCCCSVPPPLGPRAPAGTERSKGPLERRSVCRRALFGATRTSPNGNGSLAGARLGEPIRPT